MQDPVAEASRRLQHNCSPDGLGEIATGAVFLSLPLFEALKTLFAKASAEWRALHLAEMLVLFPGIWLITWGLPRLRNRLFGHREGFMLPRLMPAGGRWRALAAIPVAALAAVVLLLMDGSRWSVALGVAASGVLPGLVLGSRCEGP